MRPVRIHDHEIGPWAVAASGGGLVGWGLPSKEAASCWIKGYSATQAKIAARSETAQQRSVSEQPSVNESAPTEAKSAGFPRKG